MVKQTTRPDYLSKYNVIDVDVHLSSRYLAKEVAPEYLDEPYRSHVRRGAVTRDGWDRRLGGKISDRSAKEADAIQTQLCEEFFIDVPIISPSLQLQRVPDPDIAVELMRAMNQILIERFLDKRDNFRGLLSLSLRNPAKAAEEIDRLGDKSQVVGVILVPSGASPPLGDPQYKPIYQSAQDNDLSIAFHAAGGAFHLDFPIQYSGFRKFISVHTLAHMWGQSMTVVSLLENGIPELFPELDFIFLEGGLSWVPGVMYRLNREYSMRKSELPLLKKSPEEYITDFYFGSQPIDEPNNRTHLEYIFEMMDAPNTLMFATDYPHWDFDSPGGLLGYLKGFSDEETKNILYENAAGAFGIDI